MSITLTKENFEAEVVKSELPVLIDYWAAWCGPCKMIAPIIDTLADEYNGRVKIGKVNVDEQGELAASAGIVSIPTLVLVKDGKVLEKTVGVKGKDELIELLDKHI
ncbi:MAG: thioredoxin [Clostridia bacterium]|nr:thioredoxin [Clostridia bacterium]